MSSWLKIKLLDAIVKIKIGVYNVFFFPNEMENNNTKIKHSYGMYTSFSIEFGKYNFCNLFIFFAHIFSNQIRPLSTVQYYNAQLTIKWREI